MPQDPRKRLIESLIDTRNNIAVPNDNINRNNNTVIESKQDLPVSYYPGRFFTISNITTGLYTYTVVRSKILLLCRVIFSIILAIVCGVLYGIIIPGFNRTCCYDSQYTESYDLGECDDTSSYIYAEPTGYGIKKECDAYNITILVFQSIMFIVIALYLLLFMVEYAIYRTYARYVSQNISNLYKDDSDYEISDIVNLCFGFIGKHDIVFIFSVLDTFSPFYLHSFKFRWVAILFYYTVFIGMVLSLNILLQINTGTTCDGTPLRNDGSIFDNAMYAFFAFMGMYFLFLGYILYSIDKHRKLSTYFNDNTKSNSELYNYIQKARINAHYK